MSLARALPVLSRVRTPAATVVRAADVGTVYLYRDIGAWGGITAEDFIADLDKLQGVARLEIRINSIGGDVFEGLAICTAIKNHPAREKVAYVDGVAASIAGVIAMAADRVVMASESLMMVHQPWIFAMGSAAELRKTADLLDKASGQLSATYERKTGLSAEAVRAIMDAETWYTAEEAKAAGFADEVAGKADSDEADKATAKARAESRYVIARRITEARIAQAQKSQGASR